MKILPQRKNMKNFKNMENIKNFKNMKNIGRGRGVGENPSLPDLPDHLIPLKTV